MEPIEVYLGGIDPCWTWIESSHTPAPAGSVDFFLLRLTTDMIGIQNPSNSRSYVSYTYIVNLVGESLSYSHGIYASYSILYPLLGCEISYM